VHCVESEKKTPNQPRLFFSVSTSRMQKQELKSRAICATVITTEKLLQTPDTLFIMPKK